ncbi:MAG TPA: 50S ribosomal protein L29 [Candidatus Marinimicrobia bacterium]|nr:50S ribosomal protein L29 [Candidatus Neomarinimicrobiota bacterium]MCH2391302.1 50S ribosomal protein L29 [Nitrospinales bacterium]HBU79396.1 50S ribosomal protein L29 [Allomuricauda sp.]MDP6143582.1 50S ribosomal protein L29 [Candidatus Neomarinimicrobiota bacterium]MDP6261642.1 50S ribosomal protein L29 [Candidatus Neomarinimicrobiota bacterium]
MKKSELNEMNQAELENKLQDNLDALQNLRFQKSLQQLENPLGIKVLRRENAQIKTVLREFDLGLRTERSEK